MPSIGKRGLRQKAVLWEFSSYDNRGEARVSSPKEINVRWEQQSREIVGADGSPITVDGTVFVDKDIAEGSILWLGKKKDLPATPTSGLVEVLSLNEIPDIKGRNFVRAATVKNYRRSLPTVV